MSYEVRVSGELKFPNRQIRQAAIAKMRDAIEDEDECDSFVTVSDLTLVGTSIRIELEGSCPASMWEETVAFLEILGEAATAGSLACFFEGELSDSVKASGKSAPVKATRPKNRRKPDSHKLRMAAQFGELDEVEALLAAGTDPSAPDPSTHLKTTPLMMAAYHGKHAVVARLIAAGAAVDAQDAMGNTALFEAAGNKNKRGRRQCIQLLVEAGASLTITNGDGKTALQRAREIRASGGADELEALMGATPKRARTDGSKKGQRSTVK